MSEQQQRSISSLHLRDGGGGRAVKYRVLVFHLDRYGCRCRCYVSVRVVVVVVFVFGSFVYCFVASNDFMG